MHIFVKAFIAGNFAFAAGAALAGNTCSVVRNGASISGSSMSLVAPSTPEYLPIAEMTRDVYPGRATNRNGIDLKGMVLGLTRAKWAVEYRVEVAHGISNAGAPCFQVQEVTFNVGVSGMRVYLGSEFQGMSCLSDFVWEHEQEHVRLNTELNAKASAHAKAEVQRVLKTLVLNQGSRAEAQKYANDVIRKTLMDATAAVRDEGSKGHAHLDAHLDARSFYDTCPSDVTKVVHQLAGV